VILVSEGTLLITQFCLSTISRVVQTNTITISLSKKTISIIPFHLCLIGARVSSIHHVFYSLDQISYTAERNILVLSTFIMLSLQFKTKFIIPASITEVHSSLNKFNIWMVKLRHVTAGGGNDRIQLSLVIATLWTDCF
jgi:hypothetical protein